MCESNKLKELVTKVRSIQEDLLECGGELMSFYREEVPEPWPPRTFVNGKLFTAYYSIEEAHSHLQIAEACIKDYDKFTKEES